MSRLLILNILRVYVSFHSSIPPGSGHRPIFSYFRPAPVSPYVALSGFGVLLNSVARGNWMDQLLSPRMEIGKIPTPKTKSFSQEELLRIKISPPSQSCQLCLGKANRTLKHCYFELNSTRYNECEKRSLNFIIEKLFMSIDVNYNVGNV